MISHYSYDNQVGKANPFFGSHQTLRVSEHSSQITSLQLLSIPTHDVHVLLQKETHTIYMNEKLGPQTVNIVMSVTRLQHGADRTQLMCTRQQAIFACRALSADGSVFAPHRDNRIALCVASHRCS